MANYIGVKCPVCSKKFNQTDDVVVCPVCGAPHHRGCYAEKGECVFQSEHLNGKEWQAPVEETPPVDGHQATVKECPRCGANNPADSLFCQICGTRVTAPPEEGYGAGGVPPSKGNPGGYNQSAGPSAQGYQGYQGWPLPGCSGTQFDSESFRYGGVSPDSAIGGEKARDIATYVGSNAAYFMPRFQLFSEKAAYFSINLSAFIFSFFYFFHRKMYAIGAVLLGISILGMIPLLLYWREMMPEALADPRFAYVLQALEEMGRPYTLTAADINYARADFYMQLHTVLLYVKFAIRFAAAVLANLLYYRHVVSSVKSVREGLGSGVEPARYCAVLTYKGGISSLSVVSAVIISVVSYFVLCSVLFNSVL